MTYDVIVIGIGPAGLTAALYLRRAGLNCLNIGKDFGALKKAARIENYFGLEEPRSGQELIEVGKRQVLKLGGKIVEAEVVSITWNGVYIVETDKGLFESSSVILASGSPRRKPGISGLTEFEGRGVSYCAVCDSFFFKNKVVAVLGNGIYAKHEIDELISVAKTVYLFTDGFPSDLDLPDFVEKRTDTIKRLYGKENLEGIEFDNGRKVEVDGLFVALGTADSLDFARKLGIETDRNKIVTDYKMKTNIPGVFAAGDCTGGIFQISVAVGEGVKAALSAIEYVRNAKRQ